jgi:hypothetical protein
MKLITAVIATLLTSSMTFASQQQEDLGDRQHRKPFYSSLVWARNTAQLEQSISLCRLGVDFAEWRNRIIVESYIIRTMDVLEEQEHRDYWHWTEYEERKALEHQALDDREAIRRKAEDEIAKKAFAELKKNCMLRSGVMD